MEPVAERHNECSYFFGYRPKETDRGDVTSTGCPSEVIEVKVFDGKQLVATGKGLNMARPSTFRCLPMQNCGVCLSGSLFHGECLLNNGKVTDKVDSYTAMRKYSTRRDNNGIVRLQLNNEDVFQFGPLDQGWWPDGLYTAPTDEALVYDIQKTKDFGFYDP